MGKTKQIREKKFDRNVEISAPILDPEIIKAIHSPPNDKKLDIRHGGFKALLSDLNSQDSTDELTPITENHLPSYIGISCAVSGYSNYSSYTRKPLEDLNDTKNITSKSSARNPRLMTTHNRSQQRTCSPATTKFEHQPHINHVTIDRSTINSPDQERKELTEKLTASAIDRRRSPSPLPSVEDGRHHGAYVGARYFPMPEPSKIVHKHIPLLGIDDDQDPDDVVVEDANKVEKKIASLYGDEFVEDWKESLSHKTKKEVQADESLIKKESPRNPKDLVTLKPTPARVLENTKTNEPLIEIPTPDVKVLAGVEKQFLNRLLTDDNPPMPKSPSPAPSSPKPKSVQAKTQGNENGLADEILTASGSFPQTESPPRVMHGQPNESESLTPIHSLTENLGSVSPDRALPIKSDSSPQSPYSEQEIRDSVDIVSCDLDSETLIQINNDGPSQNLTMDSIKQNQIINPDDEIKTGQGVNLGPRIQPETYPSSPDSQQSDATVEEAQIEEIPQSQTVGQRKEGDEGEHIENVTRTQSSMDNQSSPIRDHQLSSSLIASETALSGPESSNLVSFSPEPTEERQQADISSSHQTDDKHNVEQLERIDLNTVSPNCELNIHDTRIGHTPQDEITKTERVDDSSKDGRYFLKLLEQEESFIIEQVRLAEARLSEYESELDEETVGRIRSAVGKANLLINKKCKQFRELCETNLTNDASAQYAVLNDDLAGFWDMISIQLYDMRKNFNNI